MAPTAPPRRPSAATRRTGYAIAIAVNAVMLYLINIAPGWSALPFLTDATVDVLGLVNLSLIAGVAVNVAYLGYDPLWFNSLGDLLTTGISFAALIRIWQVFPFSFGGTFDWAATARVVLLVAIVGSGIGLVVHCIRLGVRLARAGVSRTGMSGGGLPQ